MDPNETLKILRQITDHLYWRADHVGDVTEREARFTEAFKALDDWIQAGGFLPDDWQEVS